MTCRTTTRRRPAFTLVELLVTIAIMGVMTALLLPAVQSAREASRRTVCMNHLKQLSLATLNYAETHGALPRMWLSYRRAPWDNFSWRAELLPFMEEQALHDALDLQQTPISSVNRVSVAQHVATLQCPSAPNAPRQIRELGVDGMMQSNLSVGAHDFVAVFQVLSRSMHRSYPYRGIWNGHRELKFAEIPSINTVPMDETSAWQRSKPSKLRSAKDGRSKTVLLVEQAGKPAGHGSHANANEHEPSEGAWATCDYGTFFANGVNTHNYYDPFGFHGGALAAMCDGAVVLLPESIPPEILVAIFSRDGNEIVGVHDWQ